MTNLPVGWAFARLPDLIGPNGIFSDGDWVESKDQDPGGNVRLIQLADVGDGRYINKSARYLTAEKALQLRCTFLVPGDVLIARMPDPLGRACIFPGDSRKAVTVVDVCVVRGNEADFDHSWLMHFVNTPEFRSQIHQLQSGSTRKRISRGNLSTLRLPVPPRSEQSRIVAKLEELLSDLDAGVAELKAAQAKLVQYRQSLLKAAVEGALTADWRARRAALETGRPAQPAEADNRPRPAEFHASFAAGQRRRHKTPPTGGCAVQEDSANGLETGAQLLARILTERRARWEARQLARFESQGKTPPKGWQNKYPEPVAPDTRDLPELPEGWVWASIDQCSNDETAITDGPFGSNLKSEHYTESGPRVIRLQNIGDGRFLDARAHITEAHYAQLKKHAVMEGDLVVAMLGEVLPRACIVPADISPAIVKADCARIRPNTGLAQPKFLAYVLNSDPTRKRVTNQVKGIGRPRVNLGNIRSIAVPLPPYEEQQAIVDQLETAFRACDEQEKAIEHGLRQSTAQRQNLLKAAFSGQLVPQDPNDEPASVLLERIRAERVTGAAGKAPRGRRPRETA